MLSGTSWEPYSFDCKHFHNLTLHKMRARQKILEVFSSIFDHNHKWPPLLPHPLSLPNPTNNKSNQVLEMVIYTTMPLLRFSPLPELFLSSAACASFPPAHLMHLDSTVKVVGPLECLFQGAQPWLPRQPDFSLLPELHFKAMSAVLEGDQSSLNSTVIRIFSLCISLAG